MDAKFLFDGREKSLESLRVTLVVLCWLKLKFFLYERTIETSSNRLHAVQVLYGWFGVHITRLAAGWN